MMNSKLLMALSAAALLLWGCGATEPTDETEHPEQGKITLTTDWTNRTSGIDIPASYTVKVGSYPATLSGTTNTLDNLFAPGGYSLYVYNTADNIVVNGTMATANYQAGTLGWLFTCAMDVTIEKDKVHALTAVMTQQVQQLTLIIDPAGGIIERIESIAATLSGVAGSYDMANNTHGAASGVPLTFVKETDGKWKTTVRLLGVTGNEQKLTGTIAFVGGAPSDMPLVSDLTTALAAFNADKKTPLILGGQAVETPTGAGFAATIADWSPNSGGAVVAN